MLGQFVLLEFSTNFNWPAGSALSFGLLFACLILIALIAMLGAHVMRRSSGRAS
jgi:ABC-type spermidine/putrescine transport system permease subunit I